MQIVQAGYDQFASSSKGNMSKRPNDDNEIDSTATTDIGVIDTYGDIFLDRSGTYRPALGPTWYHCVTTRIVLNTAVDQYHHGNSIGSSGSGEGSDSRRVMNLVKSPIAGNVSMDYAIQMAGIVVSDEFCGTIHEA